MILSYPYQKSSKTFLFLQILFTLERSFRLRPKCNSLHCKFLLTLFTLWHPWKSSCLMIINKGVKIMNFQEIMGGTRPNSCGICLSFDGWATLVIHFTFHKARPNLAEFLPGNFWCLGPRRASKVIGRPPNDRIGQQNEAPFLYPHSTNQIRYIKYNQKVHL